MNFFGKKIVGIDISDNTIEAIEISDGKNIKVSNISRVAIPKGIVVRGEVKNKAKIVEIIKICLKNAKPRAIEPEKVIFCLPENQIFVHVFEIDKVLIKSKRENLIFKEAKYNIPIEVSDLAYSYKIIDKKEKSRVLLIGADKQVFKSWQEVFKEVGVNIKKVDIEGLAIYRGLFRKPLNKAVCILDIGHSKTKVYVFDDKSLYYSHVINIAGEYFTRAISEEVKTGSGEKIDLKQSEELKKEYGMSGLDKYGIADVLKNPVDQIVKSVNGILNYYFEKTEKNISNIIIMGGSSKMKGLVAYLKNNITNIDENSDKIKGDVPINIYAGKPSIQHKYVTVEFIEALGLAMRGIDDVWEKRDPFLELKQTKEEKKSIKNDVKESENISNEDKEDYEKRNWIKDHPKEFQLLLILFFGIIFVPLAFWYRSYDTKKRQAEFEQNELQKFPFSKELDLKLPIAIDSSEYSSDRLKGRIVKQTIDEPGSYSEVLKSAVAKTEKELNKGEAVLKDPIEKDFTEDSLIFPVTMKFLVYSETSASRMIVSGVKDMLAGDKFLLNESELVEIKSSDNPLVYFAYFKVKIDTEKEYTSITSNFSDDKPVEKIQENTETENGNEQVKSEEEKKIEELMKAINSAKNNNQDINNKNVESVDLVIVQNTSIGYLNVRSGPGTNYKVIDKIYEGDEYELLKEVDNWTNIKLNIDTQGWVYSDFVLKK